MENKNTRRGDTQRPVNKKGHYREMLSGIHNALTHTRWGSPIKTLGDDVNKYVGMPANSIPPHPAFGHPLPQGARGTARGFTLIELLVVVLIIGILAAVAVPQYQKAVTKSKAIKILTLVRSIVPAVQEYMLATGNFPTTFDELSVVPPGNLEKYRVEHDKITIDNLSVELDNNFIDGFEEGNPSNTVGFFYSFKETPLFEANSLYCYYHANEKDQTTSKSICASLGTMVKNNGGDTRYFKID